MREETVAEQNAQRISPARVRGGLGATPLCFIHHVVMHERGDMNELDDDCEIDVIRVYLACGAACEKSQNRTKAFAATANYIHNITFERRIKCRRLLCNSHLHLFGKSFRQAVLKIDPLNAALLQQSATRSALRRTGDLATIDHHVRAHRVRKAIVAASAEGGPYGVRSAAGVAAPGYNRAFPIALQSITQGAMNFFIDRH